MLILFAILITLLVLLRKTKYNSVDRYLKIISIVVPIIETVKIVWESYWDIKQGHGFNFGGLLPLYTCSMFIYLLPLAAWTKGKIKELSLTLLTSLVIFSGLTNFVFLNILNTYPIFTYAAWISIYFHFLMTFTGIFFIITGYFRPKFKNLLPAFVIFLVFASIVIPVEYTLHCNYLQTYSAGAVPVISDLANKLIQINENLRPLITYFMYIIYIAIMFLVVGIQKLVFFIIKICKSRKIKT
jgi:hypothetical protein